jgi:hypothetical protein
MTQKEWDTIRNFKPTPDFGEPLRMDFKLIQALDAWTDFIGVHPHIDCGTQGKHTEDSEHYEGFAVDVIVPDYVCGPFTLLNLFLSAVRFGFTSIGVYPEWQFNGKEIGGLHLGMKPQRYMHQWLGVKVAGENQYLALTGNNLRTYKVI